MTYVITGDELRQRRQARSLSQRDLADMLGVRPQSVSQWETGATTPSWQQAQKLEEIFDGVKPEESTRIDVLEAELAALRATQPDPEALQAAVQAFRSLEADVDALRDEVAELRALTRILNREPPLEVPQPSQPTLQPVQEAGPRS